MEEQSFWHKLFLGSIKKKIWFSFGILIFLLLAITAVSYTLNRQIEQEQIQLKNIEAPLGIMVEQVIGYDAILTGNAHWALLHAEKNEMKEVVEHKKKYDETGIKLDNLLKFEARDLLDKSQRNQEDKARIDEILKELDRVNLALVDLELGAFDAMQKGELEKARSLIVGEHYHAYKKELADLYSEWAGIEKRISDGYRQKILDNSRNVQYYNLYLGILFLLIAGGISVLISRSINNPIKKLIKSTEELRKGDFKTRVDIRTEDELEELGESFNLTAEALENLDTERKQIDKSKTEFLSITSHELRSPMTPMKAQMQMLLKDYYGKLTKQQKDSLQIVLRNTDRLDKILLDFLEISRIEAARLKFNFAKTNLTIWIKREIDNARHMMPEKNLKIELKMDKLPVIECDVDRVLQVLRNLLNNAVKFSNQNGKIVVSVEARKSDLLFSVEDNGIGIKKETQVRIFEPFFQSEQTIYRKYGGTGLGLAICKGIVESQKGKIWFKSQEGKGSIFYFTLPYIPQKEIKPIRLLFSNKGREEEEIKKAMTEFLGPLGEREFDDLKIKGLAENSIFDYIDELSKAGIIHNKQEFKNKIRVIFGGKESKKEREISEREIAKYLKK